jgi:RimJ/RimL family protein N-acetyltransferase
MTSVPPRGTVRLRPATEADKAVQEAWAAEAGPYSDWGDRTGALPVEVLGRMIVLEGETPVGDVSWHAVGYGGNAGSTAYNIGIELVSMARGRGIGTIAQRLLAEHLFATTAVHRVEASTDVTNVAEQRALESAGFIREGVLRGAQFRGDGIHHDLVSFSILRTDLASSS